MQASADDPQLWTHAARDGRRLDVVLSNTATDAKAVATAVPGYRLTGAEWFDEAIARDEKPPARLGPAAVVRLPPRSVMRLVYARR